jgi:archaetidylinositol phosphate synthase
MVLNDYREQADILIEPLAKRLTSISPNTITWISLLFALLSGLSFVMTRDDHLYLLPAILLLLLSALFDALDGKVARLTGTSSIRGDLLDHVIDRYSDIFVLGGITFSPYCPIEIGFVAIISVLMLSYTGTQAQAVGGSRNYGGWLGRADRLMLLLIGSLVQYIMIQFLDISEMADYYLLGWLMLLFILVGNLNAIQRVYDTWIELGDAKPGERENKPFRDGSRVSDGGVLRGRRIGSGQDRDIPDEDTDIEWKGH